jgi:protoheme IX farnesyltransferase
VAGDPSLGLVALTCLGGALSAGGAGAINHVLDRDIDRTMRRTADRPVASGRVSPGAGLAFGIVLGAAAFVLLATTVNLLAALLSLSGLLGYVFVYTLWLKRSSSSNIVIGGAAGAVPVLVGWTAVTNSLDWPPVVLFAVIFYWTPPHFWALAIRYRDDYARAHVPMLPVVASLRTTAVRIVLYTLLLWALTLVFAPVAGMGDIYIAAALVLGAVFTWLAVRLLRDNSPQAAMRVFTWSITYITLLFAAIALDQLVRSGL